MISSVEVICLFVHDGVDVGVTWLPGEGFYAYRNDIADGSMWGFQVQPPAAGCGRPEVEFFEQPTGADEVLVAALNAAVAALMNNPHFALGVRMGLPPIPKQKEVLPS